ncbi:MAG: NAD(P)-binding domain-containing protein [Pyrinomonadaceae bacterium]|nr:NAD(P)-binding domain-containing protein [Pyrinomonadaceae bacterium]
MQDRRDAMLIIGAGPCGLAHAKALTEARIAYEQVEADADVGGNWYHGVYRTVHIISSRKTTEFTDYPMPADYPDFPSAQQILDYMRAYAKHFNLYPKIEFNSKVTMVRPREDELWDVELSSGERRVYKGVLVCNGHHWHKRFPHYDGEFTGELMHSKDYKGPEQLADKRVLVIGGGNSACDVVSEAARVSTEAHLSLRRGYWFMPKTLLGKPIVESPVLYLPVSVQRLILRVLVRLVVGRYEDYGLPRPDHKIFEHHPTISTEVLHYLKHGRIKPRPDVARFEGHRVHFVDGTSSEFDAVVCATGFYVSFPFLPEGMVTVKNDNLAMLYGSCVLPEYKHLYVIGTRQTRYGIGPLLTPGSKLIAKMIELQNQMELPIGLVMKASGAKLPNTHLVDPIKALRQMRMAKYTMPLLLGRERRLRKKLKRERPAPPELTIQSNPDLQVY